MSLGSCSAVAAEIMSSLPSSAILPPLMNQIVGRNVTGPRYRVSAFDRGVEHVDAAHFALHRGHRIAEPVDDRDGSFAGDEPERAGLGDLGVRWLASLDGGGRHDLLAGKGTRAQPNCAGGDGADRASFGSSSMRTSTVPGAAPAASASASASSDSCRTISPVSASTVRSRSARTIDSASPIDEMISASAGTVHGNPMRVATNRPRPPAAPPTARITGSRQLLRGDQSVHQFARPLRWPPTAFARRPFCHRFRGVRRRCQRREAASCDVGDQAWSPDWVTPSALAAHVTVTAAREPSVSSSTT